METQDQDWADFADWWLAYCQRSVTVIEIPEWKKMVADHGRESIQQSITRIHTSGSRMPSPANIAKALANPYRQAKDNAYLPAPDISPADMERIQADWNRCAEAIDKIMADQKLLDAFWQYLQTLPMAAYYRKVAARDNFREISYVQVEASSWYHSQARKAIK